MITDKILIVSDYAIAKNEGGPRGYFNKCIYKNIPDNIHLLNEQIPKSISIVKKIHLRIDRFLSKVTNKKYRNKLLANKFIKVQKYKYLYFHDMYSFYDVLHLIKKDQIVLFQSHSPEIPSVEEYKLGMSSKNYKKVVKIEKLVFNRTNYLVLPNKDCVDIYTSLLKPNHKIIYLQTGIKPIENLVKIPLDQTKINIFYIGRRNDIKGFPVLIKAFEEVLKIRNDIRLFIAGSGVLEIKNKNIIDLGITHFAYDWIHSMDYVISPNKVSYFDLNIIESIAIGTPLIMTTTQGHRFFKNKNGIISIDSKNIVDKLLDTSIIYKQYKAGVKQELENLYKNELSDFAYKQRLEVMAEKVLKENN